MAKETDPRQQLALYVARYRTQADAAKALGISAGYLGDMLKGKRDISPRILAVLGLRRAVVKVA